MTRRDYIKIAKAFNMTKPDILEDEDAFNVWADVIATLCGELQSDNPLFDKNRFMNACLKGGRS